MSNINAIISMKDSCVYIVVLNLKESLKRVKVESGARRMIL